MALTGALCRVLNTVSGFSNRSLRALVADLLGNPYSAAQMSCDLRRLQAKGLIRLSDPLLAADQPPASPALRQALKAVEAYVGSNICSIP
jgi:hypothetical protein